MNTSCIYGRDTGKLCNFAKWQKPPPSAKDERRHCGGRELVMGGD